MKVIKYTRNIVYGSDLEDSQYLLIAENYGSGFNTEQKGFKLRVLTTTKRDSNA